MYMAILGPTWTYGIKTWGSHIRTTRITQVDNVINHGKIQCNGMSWKEKYKGFGALGVFKIF